VTAKKRVIFCSPYISSKCNYQLDFSKELIKETLDRKVFVFFICRKEDYGLFGFREHIKDFLNNSTYIHLSNLIFICFSNYLCKNAIVEFPEIHFKTMIVDEDKISEGSFNWLSASRELYSEHHNHEVAVNFL
jgi:hypothetical protein